MSAEKSEKAEETLGPDSPSVMGAAESDPLVVRATILEAIQGMVLNYMPISGPADLGEFETGEEKSGRAVRCFEVLLGDLSTPSPFSRMDEFFKHIESDPELTRAYTNRLLECLKVELIKTLSTTQNTHRYSYAFSINVPSTILDESFVHTITKTMEDLSIRANNTEIIHSNVNEISLGIEITERHELTEENDAAIRHLFNILLKERKSRDEEDISFGNAILEGRGYGLISREAPTLVRLGKLSIDDVPHSCSLANIAHVSNLIDKVADEHARDYLRSTLEIKFDVSLDGDLSQWMPNQSNAGTNTHQIFPFRKKAEYPSPPKITSQYQEKIANNCRILLNHIWQIRQRFGVSNFVLERMNEGLVGNSADFSIQAIIKHYLVDLPDRHGLSMSFQGWGVSQKKPLPHVIGEAED